MMQHKATQLSPLEEHLFQAWAKANQVENHDDPNNQYDHRAEYKRGNGMIHAPGLMNKVSSAHNDHMERQQESEKTKGDDIKKAVGDHVNEQDKKVQTDMQIQKAHHDLQQLLLKRKLGL